MREIELREIRQNASELVCHARADELATALSRIIVGEQVAKMPDIVTIAWATGHTVAQLTGLVEVAERVQVASCSTGGPDMEGMRQALLGFLELDDYLHQYAIPAASHPA